MRFFKRSTRRPRCSDCLRNLKAKGLTIKQATDHCYDVNCRNYKRTFEEEREANYFKAQMDKRRFFLFGRPIKNTCTKCVQLSRQAGFDAKQSQEKCKEKCERNGFGK